jgi:predicted nucleotidyltransferase component of viral defense system
MARLNGLKAWQQEKHYIQALILNTLYDKQLVFKGGTYLWFFHGLRRFSEDLDFTSIEKVDRRIFEGVANGLRLMGVENEAKIEVDDEKSFSFKIMAHGPLYKNENSRCVVYVEISKRERVIARTMPVKLNLPEYQLPIRILSGMNLEEVAAEKVRAIVSREKARDVYDLYYLIKEKGVKFNEELINAKLGYINKTYSKGLLLQALGAKSKIFENELKNLVFEPLPKFEEVKAAIEKWCRE